MSSGFCVQRETSDEYSRVERFIDGVSVPFPFILRPPPVLTRSSQKENYAMYEFIHTKLPGEIFRIIRDLVLNDLVLDRRWDTALWLVDLYPINNRFALPKFALELKWAGLSVALCRSIDLGFIRFLAAADTFLHLKENASCVSWVPSGTIMHHINVDPWELVKDLEAPFMFKSRLPYLYILDSSWPRYQQRIFPGGFEKTGPLVKDFFAIWNIEYVEKKSRNHPDTTWANGALFIEIDTPPTEFDPADRPSTLTSSDLGYIVKKPSWRYTATLLCKIYNPAFKLFLVGKSIEAADFDQTRALMVKPL